MIFAAGFGTRMAPLTDTCPKPLIRVAGRPLIDHALDQVEGAPSIVINTHYLPDQIASHLSGREITLLREPVLLDTGGGLKNAQRYLDGDTVVTMNSDAVWTGSRAIDQLVGAWDPQVMDALLLCVPRDLAVGHKGHGDFDLLPTGQITRGRELVYTGAQIISLRLLEGIDQDVFSLRELWDKADKTGRMHGMIHDGKWCDVGHPAGIDLAESILAGADV